MSNETTTHSSTFLNFKLNLSLSPVDSSAYNEFYSELGTYKKNAVNAAFSSSDPCAVVKIDHSEVNYAFSNTNESSIFDINAYVYYNLPSHAVTEVKDGNIKTLFTTVLFAVRNFYDNSVEIPNAHFLNDGTINLIVNDSFSLYTITTRHLAKYKEIIKPHALCHYFTDPNRNVYSPEYQYGNSVNMYSCSNPDIIAAALFKDQPVPCTSSVHSSCMKYKPVSYSIKDDTVKDNFDDSIRTYQLTKSLFTDGSVIFSILVDNIPVTSIKNIPTDSLTEDQMLENALSVYDSYLNDTISEIILKSPSSSSKDSFINSLIPS